MPDDRRSPEESGRQGGLSPRKPLTFEDLPGQGQGQGQNQNQGQRPGQGQDQGGGNKGGNNNG